MQIIYSPSFLKKYKKLPIEIKRLAEKKEKIFRNNPFDTSLKTHRLHGKFKGAYSFSINYEYRILFEVKENQIFIFLLVGKHNIYK
ncbi:type II toxin-antitoxin system mRNA interferase toxin, RelE/StbE family [Patescibacteria group bacterium]|nr:type II toxin-antitoxin system mRNA interferase toxin, RelE/StbE family [Patescibacteria group bacterium]